MQETLTQESKELEQVEVIELNDLRQKSPSKEFLGKAKVYLTETLRLKYFDKVDSICEANPSLAKYKGIIKHDINRQLSTIASKIIMYPMLKLEDFGSYVEMELETLENLLEILERAEKNPFQLFTIEDLKKSIYLINFKLEDNELPVSFDLAVLFSIRTLLLNAKSEVKDKFNIRLEIFDQYNELHFKIHDNSSEKWPIAFVSEWQDKYIAGTMEPDNVSEIVTGGAGLVAYTSGQRAAKYNIPDEYTLVNYVNKSAQMVDKFIEVIFPHQQDQLQILS